MIIYNPFASEASAIPRRFHWQKDLRLGSPAACAMIAEEATWVAGGGEGEKICNTPCLVNMIKIKCRRIRR